MLNKNNLPYLIVIASFVLLKLGFRYAGNDTVLFLLKPMNFIIEGYTGYPSIYNREVGFINAGLNIIIDKSCSGFNFFILSFLMILFYGLTYLNQRVFRILAAPVSLILAFAFTILVNASRILTSVTLQSTPLNNFPWVHQAEGAFIYLSFLILLYLVIHYSFTKFKKNAKSA